MRLLFGSLKYISFLTCLLPYSALSEQFLACQEPTVAASDFERSLKLNLPILHIPHRPTPTLSVVDLPESNAYAIIEQNKIVISAALFTSIMNSAEEIFVLAHEIGHLANTPTAPRQALWSHGTNTEEASADSYALARLREQNLDAGAGVTLLARLVGAANSSRFRQLHQQRIAALTRSLH